MRPVDGNNLDNLDPILKNLRYYPNNKTVILHINTTKGVGYPPVERASDRMHEVAKFDLVIGR